MNITKELSVPLSDELLAIHDSYFDEPVDDEPGPVQLERVIVSAAKDKLAEIITSLLWEKDTAYSFVFPEVPESHRHGDMLLYDLIYSDKTRKVRPEAWQYTDLESAGDTSYGYSSDYGLGAVLYHLGEDLLLVQDLYTSDYLGVYSDEHLNSEKFGEEILESVEFGWLHEWLYCKYGEDSITDEEQVNPEYAENFIATVRSFLIAFSKATRGEMYQDDIMDALVEDFQSVWGEDIPPSYFLNRFDLFGECLFYGNEDQRYITSVVRSKDIYNYLKGYREKLPTDVRDTVDSYIKLLSNPFGINGESYMPSAYEDCDDESKSFIFTVMCMDGSCGSRSYDFSYANPFYETAILWLDRNLPILEAEYGAPGKGASTSVLVLCCQKLLRM